ncbi:MAG: TonB-dependent receptor plug domain-containing protein [Prevotella sp.]|nr:TonB-dependent receptor plug domain-containing protein [Prevotella sp.]
MNRKIVMAAALLGMSVTVVNADNEADGDSLRMEQLQEVVVKGVWVQKNAPFAVANIKKDELQKFSKTGKELPFLFAQTPGILAWGENGLGTGTSYLRIRGAGDSRINVTLDGVPMNSPEDQCVFWANMNSYSSLLGGVQIQRGVGTSTNGDGAFGGTVALSSKTPSEKAGGEVNFSYGSYNTFNVGGSFSTGLLWNHLIFDGAYHETNTDGYIHGTSGRSGSYYGGLTWLDDHFTIRYKNIGNFEKTGQAWNGITAGDNDMSLMDGTYGMKTGIKDYEDLYKVGLGKYNTLYETLAYDADGNFKKDADGNYVTERYKMADGSLWDKTTDNFWQNHNILSAAWDINERWSTTASLHYTHGYGYYKEFRLNNKLKKFGLNNYTLSDGSTLKKTDFVRKKGLKQDTYGVVGNINYKDENWDIIGGLSVQQFDGNHFGHLTYIKNEELRQHLMNGNDYQYYDSDAHKLDASAFIKALYRITDSWDVFADMQYRHVGYKTDGYNDKFYEDGNTGEIKKHYLDINNKYDFFNPKAGVSFHQDGHRAFFSAALSHREPERNNFTDNGSYPAPKAESLLDFELGYSYSAQNWRAGATLYYMDYTDQFVQTGAQSDIGEALTTNIKDSYRMGVELTAGVDITPWLSIEGNAALSQNKIKDFDEVVEDWDNGSQTIHYDNSTLAFSPSTILNGFVNFHQKRWTATWHTGYVSRMYLDNTECKDRSLPGYSVSNFNVNYALPVKKFLKEIVFGANLNNIFNKHFAQSGWVYSAIYSSGGHPNDNRYYQIGFVPSAGFTAMGSITLKF